MTNNPYSLSAEIAAGANPPAPGTSRWPVPPVPPPVQNPGSPPVICPACRRQIDHAGDGLTVCQWCRWKGQTYVFTPLPLTVDHAEQALTQDATCIHHPTKRAVAVCAGTGDYICALCAVELNGETYSAAYLSNAGKQKVGKAFDRYIERPDSIIIVLLLLSFIPPINYLLIPAGIVWIPYAIYLYVKALRMRKINPLFARLMGRWRLVLIPIFLALFALGWVAALLAIVYALIRSS